MPWEDVFENSNSEIAIPTFWDDVDIKPKEGDVALIDCPRCQKRLRVPVDYSGRLTCPSCSKAFDRQNGEVLYRINNDEEWTVGENILMSWYFQPLLRIMGFIIVSIYLLCSLYTS